MKEQLIVRHGTGRVIAGHKLKMEVLKANVNLPLTFCSEKDGRLAFILDNVLTEAECSDLIKITEDQGYEPALLNVGGGQQQLCPEVRNNLRCIIDSVEKANIRRTNIKLLASMND